MPKAVNYADKVHCKERSLGIAKKYLNQNCFGFTSVPFLPLPKVSTVDSSAGKTMV
jgi:hypothetical protein